MPDAVTEHEGASPQTDAHPTQEGGSVAPEPKSPGSPSPGFRSTRRRWLLIGAVIVVLVLAGVFGIPEIELAFTTVSTDDAYVNGHVTFVAPRVGGQISRVLVDDNNRVHKGDLLAQIDKEPFRDRGRAEKSGGRYGERGFAGGHRQRAGYRSRGQKPALEIAERRGGPRKPSRSFARSGCRRSTRPKPRWHWHKLTSIGQSNCSGPRLRAASSTTNTRRHFRPPARKSPRRWLRSAKSAPL